MRLVDLGYEEDSSKIKVAILTAAFNNYDMLRLLDERGTAIKEENWEEQKKVQKKIIDLKNQHLKRLQTPCHLFITF